VTRLLLEARDIRIGFGDQSVVDGASLALSAGEVVTLEGASGSGKSTFLRILASLLEPDGGTLLLGGAEAHTISPRVFRRRVAYVAQDPPMLEGTVADNVATGPRLREVRMDDADVARVLARVGLAGFAGRTARELSGGERQRVALARALANAPEVLLLDEPTSALDPSSAKLVISLVRTLAGAGLAVVAVTHVREHAAALGGRRLVFERGRVHVRQATP
jgi:putative ABC transport system ATP-binding protein